MPITFHEIPNQAPTTPLLDKVYVPRDLRRIPEKDLGNLANELREELLYIVSRTGGHFSAGLGVIELTIALHYVYNTPFDRLVWDVGHQTLPHKVLTGRRGQMRTLRKKDGLSAFPRRSESEYDSFGVGHSSTSISAALGMAVTSKMQSNPRKVIAIIGDGALTAGMAFEALNHAPSLGANILVIINDNEMSISANVGALSSYLSKLLATRGVNNFTRKAKSIYPEPSPILPNQAIFDKTLFEELGWSYLGPVDGHDLPLLTQTLRSINTTQGAKILHVVTKKGKGFVPAEKDPITYHAIDKFKKYKKSKTSKENIQHSTKYSSVFGRWLCDMADIDGRLVGITPAMKEGSDLVEFSCKFPSRYFDVAIAEQHAVTFASGMACEGAKPVVAIYSTFLQRAYDQLIHDVTIQKLDVLFAIDRAGFVGEDGPTHSGSFDLSYLRCIPGMIIMTPSNANELRKMLTTGYLYQGPAAVRYPRGAARGFPIDKDLNPIRMGKGVIRRYGLNIVIFVFGTRLAEALKVGDVLNTTVVDMRFVKPLDEELIRKLSRNAKLFATIEENTIMGGAGSAVSEFIAREGIVTPILHLGFPDLYIEHGETNDMLSECGLDSMGIESAVRDRIYTLGLKI